MSSGEDKIRARIKELETEYVRTQKNKATEGHLGLLKAKLSKLKRELVEGGAGSINPLNICCIDYILFILGGKKTGGAGERGFEVSKSGDTRVGLIGFPSVGKSTLLTKLTGTFSLAAGYEFTTLTAIPGTMHYRGAKIQILDLPGITTSQLNFVGCRHLSLLSQLFRNHRGRERWQGQRSSGIVI